MWLTIGFCIVLTSINTLSLFTEAVIVDFINITQVNNEFISSSNNTDARQAGYGFIKFEGETDGDNQHKYGFVQFENVPSAGVSFEDSPSGSPFEYELNRPVKFEETPSVPNNYGADPSEPIIFEDNGDVENSENSITFQDDNILDQKPVQKKKRRRRKRKPRLQNYYQPGSTPQVLQQNPGLPYPGQNPAGFNPESGNYQGYRYPQSAANNHGNYGYYQGQYRPPRRVRRLQQDALTAITSALSSVAQYDDLQCVPRLLCEAAGGAGAGAGAGLLAGLQPLLTLLSAYNVVSASPLFVFGRAVFLGMTSKGNAATCRYAYSSCPTDPEQLVHYLNNHNGGFFRFFNSPQRPGQQNLQQFYNQLSGAYGQLPLNGQPDNSGGYGQPDNGQNYGYYEPNQGQYGYIQNQNQNYGLYQQNGASTSSYAPNYVSNYPHGQHQYGFAQNIYRNGEEKEIQNRIQNNPSSGLVNNYGDDTTNKYKLLISGTKYSTNNGDGHLGEGFKFPEQNKEPESYAIRDSKVFIFPQNQGNRQYESYRPQQSNNDNYNNVASNEYANYASNKYQNNNYASNNYLNNNYASNNHANNNYASSNYPSNNYASNNHANNNYASSNYPSTNYVSNSYASSTYPSNNYASNINANNNYASSNYPSNNYASNNYASNNYASNYYASNNYANNRPAYNNKQGITTVYVIRGNGDPNKPEIVNLRPGESLT